jgi:tetratricopeptide (TPR) repeat protein
MKPSRLLLRLEAGIGSAKNTLEADCLRAERAAYLARLGRFEEVQAELAALHERYDARPNVEISAWVNLVEGVEIHSRSMGKAARDKILRAHALSGAAGLPKMRALSAAWLAHLDFLLADVASMTRHADEALTLAHKSHDAARARANLVVAQGYHQGGRLDLALPWYFCARQHAISDGDDAMISALMHNMAWLRASNLRQEELLRGQTTCGNDHALLSAQSTEHYDLLVGATNLQGHIPMLKAKLLVSKGQPADALVLFDEYLHTAIGEGLGRLQADLIADRAWCRVQLGQMLEARGDANLAESNIDPQGQFDDRAFAHSRLAEVFLALGSPEAAAHHQRLAEIAWHGYVEFQAQMVTALKGMVSNTAS